MFRYTERKNKNTKFTLKYTFHNINIEHNTVL